MKQNQKIIVISAAITAIIAVAGIAASSYAFGGDGFEKNKPNFTSEQREEMKANHEAMKEALDNNDYEAWKELVGDKPVSEKITEEKFSRLVEAHSLMQSGDKEGAKAVFDELGLKGPRKFGKMGKMKRGENGPRFEDKNGDGVCDHLDID